jgi:cell filamentation protein
MTACADMDKASPAEAIVIVHVELILIHPFYEGNGRLSRLLATVMALQAGWPLPDFTAWDSDKDDYFSAIQAGLDDYQRLTVLVRQLLDDSAGNEP